MLAVNWEAKSKPVLFYVIEKEYFLFKFYSMVNQSH